MTVTVQEIVVLLNRVIKAHIDDNEDGCNMSDKFISELSYIARHIQSEGIAPPKCVWTENEHEAGVYDTQCGNRFVFIEGGLAENSASYCMYCGGELDIPEFVAPKLEVQS